MGIGVKCGRGMTLTTHPHLMSRSQMSRGHVAYMVVVGQLYFYLGRKFVMLFGWLVPQVLTLPFGPFGNMFYVLNIKTQQ
jgi:hypothetical protein